jgi:hypothetical protein
MSRAKQAHDNQIIKLTLSLSPSEADEFKVFLKETGRKAGPWVRTLIIQSIRKEVIDVSKAN